MPPGRRAQIRISYGDHDLDVLPEEARLIESEMKRRGASVTAISVGPLSHNESALRAIPRAIQWFNEGAPAKSER